MHRLVALPRLPSRCRFPIPYPAPRRPPGRIIGGPPGDVLIEGPNEYQLAAVVDPRPHRLPGGVADVGQAFLPGLRDLRRQPERADAGMVDLQVTPEQPAQVTGDGAQ